MLSFKERFGREKKGGEYFVPSPFRLTNAEGNDIPLFERKREKIVSKRLKYAMGKGFNCSLIVSLSPQSTDRIDFITEYEDAEGNLLPGIAYSAYHVRNGKAWFQRTLRLEEEKPLEAYVPKDLMGVVRETDPSGLELDIAGYHLSLTQAAQKVS